MSAPDSHIVTRYCDVAVVGGSAAGLAAALQLVRQRRSVLVIDSGEPRNQPTAHLHGYLSRDGAAPGELLAAGRDEVRRYGGEIVDARVSEVSRTEDGQFAVQIVGGHRIFARRVIAATGLTDVLPDIDGLAAHWGREVIHCPFCHGFEVRDQRIVAIVTHPAGLHPVRLLWHLSDRLTVVLHEPIEVDSSELDLLRAAGTGVRSTPVRRLVEGPDGTIAAVELSDGECIDADVVAVGPRFRPRLEPFVSLGLRPDAHPGGLGDVVSTDASGQSAVPGLYAAGNVTDPSQQLAQAAGDGSRVGAMVAFDLAEDDLHTSSRPSGNQNDWDHRYSGGPMWSGNPNGSLVSEAAALTPGRALDVGAGEGGDALWLAEQGWRVSAADISARALDRIDAEAKHRGLPLECLHADANALAPFPAAVFDLVTAHYASIPRTPDDRGVGNILRAVAPGGVLLVVSHDLQAMRDQGDGHAHRPAFDPDAYVRVEDFAAALAGSADWDIEVNETRPRSPGAVGAAHHVDDVVLRARRRVVSG